MVKTHMNSNPTLLEYQDIYPGLIHKAGPYLVTESEIISFASKWDPRPYHIDRDIAEAGPFQGIIGSSSHTMAIRTLLLAELDQIHHSSIIATMGWSDVKFANPVRPNDQISLSLEWLDKRVSKSKPDVGIVRQKLQLLNQSQKVVLEYIDTVAFKIR